MKPKKLKKVDGAEIPELPEGETVETCKEHVACLKKEMKKTSNKNVTMIRELMDTTYATRRKSVLLEPKAIDEVLKEYPALRLMSEVSYFVMLDTIVLDVQSWCYVMVLCYGVNHNNIISFFYNL